jgi:hypothetical protein
MSNIYFFKMSDVIIKPTFIDSPRNLFLRDLHLAFAQGDVSAICASISEKIHWQIIGRRKLGEIENRNIDSIKRTSCKVEQLIIVSIIETGQEACVSGSICFVNKSQFMFANVFRFKQLWGTKIESIDTFMLRH